MNLENFKPFTLLALLFYSVVLLGQNQYNARFTYVASIKLHDENKSITKGKKEYNDFFKNIPKQIYFLDISNNQSIFYSDKKMDVNVNNKNNLISAFVGNGHYYHDTKTNTTLNDKNVLGEDFLIQTNVKYKWELSSEKKMIRNHTCFKATTIEEYYNRIGNLRTKKITAWYCPKIPINVGIKDYHGLPGAILSLTVGDVIYECTQVALNLKEAPKINKPTKGRLITKKEYENILKTDFTKKFGIKN